MDADNNKEKIVDEYFNKVIAGLSFDEVRRSLEKSNFSEEDIKFIVRKVDDRVLAHDLKKPQTKLGQIIMWSGLGLMAIGLAMTLANYYKLIDLGDTYLNLYGPFIAGMIVYILGKNRKQKEQQE